MDAVVFFKELNKMCKAYTTDNKCNKDCPLYELENKDYGEDKIPMFEIMKNYAEELVMAVDKWSKEGN